jgi:hypothetical protein
MISRDSYEHLREDLAVRMRTQTARRIYARRAPIGEGVFATLKATLGFRRFSRRGRIKVGAELLWICTAYNLMKLIQKASGGPKTPLNNRPTLGAALRTLAEGVQLIRNGLSRYRQSFLAPLTSERLWPNQIRCRYAAAD